MKNQEILKNTTHRPFPVPHGPWMMKQVWEDLLFAHWPVEEAELLPYIPSGLKLEKNDIACMQSGGKKSALYRRDPSFPLAFTGSQTCYRGKYFHSILRSCP